MWGASPNSPELDILSMLDKNKDLQAVAASIARHTHHRIVPIPLGEGQPMDNTDTGKIQSQAECNNRFGFV